MDSRERSHTSYIGLTDTPTLFVTTLQKSTMFLNRERCTVPNHGLTPDYPLEDAFAVYLMLEPMASWKMWCDGKPRPVAEHKAGEIVIYNLDQLWRAHMHERFDCLHIHVARGALDEIAWEAGTKPIQDLFCPPHENTPDPVVHALGTSLLPALEHPERASQLFVEHVSYAMNLHLATVYGKMQARATRLAGALSPWQMRRATDYLIERLNGQVSLLELAQYCGLSRSHFSRAFKRSTGRAPHQWLAEKRVERAKDLLVNTTLSLADIAIRCGYADQSHFSRAFTARASATPSQFRRTRSPKRRVVTVAGGAYAEAGS
ncbi:helix-turn-helix domain-containing protein [Trinickia sp.]|uniref:helix-turn-helix domain-containing protein n=1 Tax=Trinickia sp. TaxID=2571163 RepID=UPI003F8041B0